ncbi:MAG: xanthine dehydrogenase [marine bacterium B5-7]|nr:MAG: xanthine dehydrogenase [marine bacterium B5-7]
MANQFTQLLNTYQLLQSSGHDAVLATIIETMGSTYQKSGARMLIARDGEFTGLLGGGCFEADLSEQAASVFEDKQSKVIFYDMRSPEDEIWGLGLGCNGAVRVSLQYLSKENNFSPLRDIAKSIEHIQTGVLATICESNHEDYPINQNLFFQATKQEGQFVITKKDEMHTVPAQRVLLQDKAELVEHHINDKSVTVFYDLIKPALRLLVLGAGPDAVPVTQFAKSLGWHVAVVDHREAYIKPERFPDVDQLLNIVPIELNEKLALDQFDALIVMTHSIDYDERYLKIIADSHIPYIGLLGPAKRRDRLLDTLGRQAEKIKGRVYGPTGLDIGANTPQEIALSIMAEIQAVLANRDGSQLCQQDQPIQERKLAN